MGFKLPHQMLRSLHQNFRKHLASRLALSPVLRHDPLIRRLTKSRSVADASIAILKATRKKPTDAPGRRLPGMFWGQSADGVWELRVRKQGKLRTANQAELTTSIRIIDTLKLRDKFIPTLRYLKKHDLLNRARRKKARELKQAAKLKQERREEAKAARSARIVRRRLGGSGKAVRMRAGRIRIAPQISGPSQRVVFGTSHTNTSIAAMVPGDEGPVYQDVRPGHVPMLSNEALAVEEGTVEAPQGIGVGRIAAMAAAGWVIKGLLL